MFTNYLKIAWRNLYKHKSFAVINITGLAIGIAACTLIFLYVRYESSFDQYNTKADRIARVTLTLHAPESDVVLAVSPTPLAPVLQSNYPEVEMATRLENVPQVMRFNNDLFTEEAFYKADNNFFQVFSAEFLEGSPETALQKPQSIVLTEKMARKYFANYTPGNVLGKTITCSQQPLAITGVIKDRPGNSDLKIEALLSADFSKNSLWLDDFSTYTFVLFRHRTNLTDFTHKLARVAATYVQPELDKSGEQQYKVSFETEALKDVHFSKGKLIDTPKGNRQIIYIFSLLAIFILAIALLNYINLSTAKATERAKEVGIRKVSGANRWQLARQFIFESLLLVSIAWLIALSLVLLVLPFFNTLLGSQLSLRSVQNLPFIISLFVVTLLLSGTYPAFVLSGFQPVMVLKGTWRKQPKGVWLRKAVTVVQFTLAAALIMGTTVIYQQMKFIQTKDLGFNKDQLLNIFPPNDSASSGAVKAFQQQLFTRPEVKGITAGSGLSQAQMGSTTIEWEGKKRELMCRYYHVDQHFLNVFQIHLKEGRNFDESYSTDKTQGFLVNEAFIKMMGWKSGIGKKIDGFGRKGPIVGVVKNFYYESLHNIVDPVIMVWNKNPANTVTTVKINPSNLSLVKELFKKSFPYTPVDYLFMDEMIARQYEAENTTMKLFNYFTLLAIVVSGLGLYGLVALIAAQRTKEIGVRKVLGASLAQLFSLLSGDFLRLVGLALLIALPVAGYVMHQWLSTYAYHISLSWWMFLVPAIASIVIALLVISRDIIRTAIANPVKSLRAE